jgi:hypothetical protein
MLDLLVEDVAVAGVTREVLDREQVDEPQADVADTGVCPDVVEVEAGGDHAGTLAGALEFGDHVGQGRTVVDDETSVARRRAAVTFALGQASQDVLKPDPFGDCGVLDQSDRGGQRRDETAAGLCFGQPAHRVDQLGPVAVEHALEQSAFAAGGD